MLTCRTHTPLPFLHCQQVVLRHATASVSTQQVVFSFDGAAKAVERAICLHPIAASAVVFSAAVTAVHQKEHWTMSALVQNGRRLLEPADAGAGRTDVQSPSTTLLHEAAYVGHKETIRILVLTGSNAARKDVGGLRPVDIARACGHPDDVVAVLAAAAAERIELEGLSAQLGTVRAPNFPVLGAAAAAAASTRAPASRSMEWASFQNPSSFVTAQEPPAAEAYVVMTAAEQGARLMHLLRTTAELVDETPFVGKLLNPRYRDESTSDALIHVAVNTEKYEFALRLIDVYGVLVNSRTKVGETAVTLIVTRCLQQGWFGSADRVVLNDLIKRGASTDVVDLFGRVCRAETSDDMPWPTWTTHQLSRREIERQNEVWKRRKIEEDHGPLDAVTHTHTPPIGSGWQHPTPRHMR